MHALHRGHSWPKLIRTEYVTWEGGLPSSIVFIWLIVMKMGIGKICYGTGCDNDLNNHDMKL